MKRPYKRRRILVDTFQYRLLAFNLMYFLTILFIFAAALFLPLMIRLQSDVLSFVEKQEVANEFLLFHSRVWPAIFIIFVLLALHSVFISHRIAGPLYQFRNILEAVTAGNLTVRATIRESDYLHREAAVINDMIAHLNTRIRDIEDHSEELQAGLVELKKAIGSGATEEVNQTIRNLEAQMDRLKLSVDQFRTGAQETRVGHRIAEEIMSTPHPGDSGSIIRS